ncbi:DUF1127 domain-containing protein [Thioclava atlantica]|uniref:YjiS-like domain-containing protein n=1 Tax=Thioclava atlantica TaxID=1317124 RepID=A0A085TYH9_9RHOB|nr:DUF1127 domain-containing protein [Thioclava atlantica]KFE35776.1 hypothetical protein DW2_07428 [Thioclava atlantica]
MSSIDINRMSARNVRPGLLASMIAALQAWNDHRVTRKALLKLSDRALEDIGLTRFDIAHMR